MPWCDAPRVDVDEEPQYRWPSWRVGHELEDLFGELHEQFNTVPIFIQDPDAFHHDVAELASDAPSKAEFHTRLQERRNQRLEELRDFEKSLAALMTRGFSRLDGDQLKSLFALCRTASFDSLISFCASFLGPDKYGTEPSLDQFKKSSIPNPRMRRSSSEATTSLSPVVRELNPEIINDRNEMVSEPATVIANRKRKRTGVLDHELPPAKSPRVGSSLAQTIADKYPEEPSLQMTTKTAVQTEVTASRPSRQKLPRVQSKPQAAATSHHSGNKSFNANSRHKAPLPKGAVYNTGADKCVPRGSRRLEGKPPETSTLP